MVSVLIYSLAFVFGISHAFLFAPVPRAILQIIILAALLGLLRLAKRPVLTVWIFGTAWFSAGLYWLHFSMHDVGGLPVIASIALVVILAMCLSAFYALAIYFWSRWTVNRRSNPMSLCVGFPLAWLAADLARGYLFFGGFPWLATGYVQVDNPLLKGWFSVLGVYGVGLLTTFLSGVLLSLVLLVLKQITLSSKTLVALCGATLVLFVTGLILQGILWSENMGTPITVRMIQPNIPQNLKFDNDETIKNTTAFISQAKNSPKQLTVFPETAIPYAWSQLPEEHLQSLKEGLTDQRAVLMGAVGESSQGYYNSAMWLDKTVDVRNPPRYDKNHLLPMGETVPFGFKWLFDKMDIPLGGYQAGSGFVPFKLRGNDGNLVRVSVNICYENEFGEELITAWKDGDDLAPNVWVNMTNLGWFGTRDVSTNQLQHLFMSRVRAMEMARPMLVATNTGTSASIDDMGDIVEMLPPDQEATWDVLVQPRQGSTPYVLWGNAPLFALLSLSIGIIIIRRHRHTDI